MSTAPCSSALPPAVPAGDADEDDDGEADHPGGHPAVQQQHGEGEGGAGAGAAPPAVAAEGDEMADDDAGEHGEGPADGAGREEGVLPGERPVEAGAQDERRRAATISGGQRGPGQLPVGVVARQFGSRGPRGERAGAAGADARAPRAGGELPGPPVRARRARSRPAARAVPPGPGIRAVACPAPGSRLPARTGGLP